MYLQVQNLQKRYGLATVLDLPELNIDSGASFGLVGNNGAGKTTFLRLVLDLIPPSEGQVLLNGQDVSQDDAWKTRTGSYLDSNFLIDYLTPAEYIHFVGSLYGMSSVQIEEKWDHYRPFFGDQPLDGSEYIRNFIRGQQGKKMGPRRSLDGRAATADPGRAFCQSRSDEPNPPQGHAENPSTKPPIRRSSSPATISTTSPRSAAELPSLSAASSCAISARPPDTLRELERYFAVEET